MLFLADAWKLITITYACIKFLYIITILFIKINHKINYSTIKIHVIFAHT